METQIINLLQCTKHQYEMLVFMHFMYWCEIHSKTNEDLQCLLANSAIEQWFQIEYRKLQLNFLKLATPYNNYCNKSDRERLYRIETIHIRNLFPKSLIKLVRIKNYVIQGNPLAN